MSPEPEPTSEFDRLLRADTGVDLERVALEIAADHDPETDVSSALAYLESMGSRLRHRLGPDAPAQEILRQINWLLYIEEGFRGNREDYDDPRNSFLNEVLERRIGIPITLALVYRALARRVGLDLEGVNLPGHFVLRTVPPEVEWFIDAYHEGRRLDRAGCHALVSEFVTGQDLPTELFEPMDTRLVTRRLLLNLQRIFRTRGAFPSLAMVLERLHRLSPEVPGIVIQLAEVDLVLGRPGRGLAVLEQYLGEHPGQESLPPFSELRRRLRQEVSSAN